MKLAFIVDPLSALKAKKDTSIALMREAARRGHEVYALHMDHVRAEGPRILARGAQLALHDDNERWCSIVHEWHGELNAFDRILMRKDPPFDLEYLYATHLLDAAQRRGARVINRPQALRDYNEKLSILRFSDWITPTLVSGSPEELARFIDSEGDAVLKPLDGMGGTGVFRVRKDDPNRNVIVETLTHHGARTIMAQRFIAEITQGDKRILVVDGKPAPYALARIPKPGESRGNLAAGGTGVAQPLSARDRAIAEAVGPQFKADGLTIVGLDVIGDYITEINVTSPTCMMEIAEQTGFSVAGMTLDAIESA